MVHADYLFLMTDVDCLYTDNPRKNPDAKPISVVNDISEIRQSISTSTMGSSLGTGGMETKIIAAELATGAGVTTVVCHGAYPQRIFDIISNNNQSAPAHTAFLAKSNPLRDRKWWILHGLNPAGHIIVDTGAGNAIIKGGGRLLPAGVIKVYGTFAIGQAVTISVLKSSPGLAGDKTSLNSISPLSLTALKIGEDNVSTPPTPQLAPLHVSSSVSSLDAANSLVGVTNNNNNNNNHNEDILKEGNLLELGRGLANYNSTDIDRVKGLKSSKISEILGFADSEHVVEQIVIKNF